MNCRRKRISIPAISRKRK